MIWNSMVLAVRAIRRSPLRAVLTLLGIVIGVAAVVSMVTLGNGATRAVSDQIASLGSNLLMVNPGQRLGPSRGSAGAPSISVWQPMAMKRRMALRHTAPWMARRSSSPSTGASGRGSVKPAIFCVTRTMWQQVIHSASFS